MLPNDGPVGSAVASPTATSGSAGNPSYAAYDYQIDVTIWLALELMLAKGLTDEIEIEPPSFEDVEASLTNPGNASLGIVSGLGGIRLIVQIKSRTTAPWSTKAFAGVLLGKQDEPSKTGQKRGPRSRRRPLDMLIADPAAYYLFVTNEALDAGLRPHQNISLLVFPEPGDLPPYCRAGHAPTAKAALAKRIGICDGVTLETLEWRITKLLDKHGNVAPQRMPGCLEDMRAAVRRRLAGAYGGRWSMDDLAAIVLANGGSRFAHRTHDNFVPPRSFRRIKDVLRDAHAVIIVGPSGTGKSLTADIIAAQLGRESPPSSSARPRMPARRAAR